MANIYLLAIGLYGVFMSPRENDDQQYPSRTLDKVVVRLPDGMREALKAEADRNSRSVNAEITARLSASFDEGPSEASPEEIIALVQTAVADSLSTHAKQELQPQSSLDKIAADLMHNIVATAGRIDDDDLARVGDELVRLKAIEAENIRSFLKLATEVIENMKERRRGPKPGPEPDWGLKEQTFDGGE